MIESRPAIYTPKDACDITQVCALFFDIQDTDIYIYTYIFKSQLNTLRVSFARSLNYSELIKTVGLKKGRLQSKHGVLGWLLF